MKPLNIVFWVIGAFVVIFPSSVWWFLWQQESQRVKVPNVGDVASAFNDIVSPIFAALAFAGLVYTALMQREELVLQRKQLEDNQKELKRQADAQVESQQALLLQVDATKQTARLSAATTILEHNMRIKEGLADARLTGNQQEHVEAEIMVASAVEHLKTIVDEIHGRRRG